MSKKTPDWRKKQVTAHMACLHALAKRAFPAATAREVRDIINGHDLYKGKRINQRNVESRLCELVRFRLVQAVKLDGDRYTTYMIADRGYLILQSGDVGESMVKQLATKHYVLEKGREEALRPTKEEWTRRIENECAMMSNNFFSK